MKKLLFVLAIVAVYGLSVTSVKAGVIVSEKAKVTIVADDSNPGTILDDPKKAEVKKEAGCCSGKADVKSADKAAGTGCPEAKTTGCPSAKSEGCPHAKECAGEKEVTPTPKKK